MKELKLGEIRGLLPEKMAISNSKYLGSGFNKCIDELTPKNLLDYVKAVVCPDCNGKGYIDAYQNKCTSCKTGAVIRVKEG